jgi:hypothetical protein
VIPIQGESCNKSVARNQLLPADNMMKASSEARSVQLSGISHCRPFLSRRHALCSTALFFAGESLELTTGERVKGMGYLKTFLILFDERV